MEDDPFESVLGLEEKFYEEGYRLGVEDGARSGRIEGRAFGLERGFEKFVEMGRLHGRAVVWGNRFSIANDDTRSTKGSPPDGTATRSPSSNPRLEKHIRTLYALAEPASISTQNNEDAVSDFDDRLKRAKAKSRIIERIVGEKSMEEAAGDVPPELRETGEKSGGEGNIEDIGNLGLKPPR
ncbi:MAG: hypothetical protein M4579_007275 [Chaenotheca gracillima]|nr:MAG: hypothetical protein M4579_007275 [Chaenotheca gracillima]